jgi:hypothetical protein
MEIAEAFGMTYSGSSLSGLSRVENDGHGYRERLLGIFERLTLFHHNIIKKI